MHTGEVERDQRALRGIAVHLARGSRGSAGEVLVPSTVRDLVAGSGLSFVDRGVHELKGIPEPRQVLAVSAGPDYTATLGSFASASCTFSAGYS